MIALLVRGINWVEIPLSFHLTPDDVPMFCHDLPKRFRIVASDPRRPFFDRIEQLLSLFRDFILIKEPPKDLSSHGGPLVSRPRHPIVAELFGRQ